MSPVTFPSRQIATVRVCVDFPDAEGIWVTSEPVYSGDSISRAIERAGQSVLDGLAKDAGQLYADRVRYGKGLLRSDPL